MVHIRRVATPLGPRSGRTVNRPCWVREEAVAAAIGLIGVSALVTCLFWYLTGRSSRYASPPTARGHADGAWVTDEGG